MKSKTKNLSIFISIFATFTRLDILELQKKSKKKKIYVKGTVSNSLKGAIGKKSFGSSVLYYKDVR